MNPSRVAERAAEQEMSLNATALDPARFSEHRTIAGRPLGVVAELRDIRAHSALLFELIHRDLTVRYRRSVLGFVWTMLHPLLLMLIFVVVFSSLFSGPSKHYEVYFLSAYVAWNFFSQTVVAAMLSVAWNGPLMKRVRVPPSIFTISIVLSGLVNLGLSMSVLFVIMLVVGAPFSAALWMLPFSLLILSVFTIGVSLGLTAVSTYFGDVREMVQAGMPALLYLTPVIYPRSIIPDRYQLLIKLNPLFYVVEIVRGPIHDGTVPSPATLLIASVLAVGSLVVGWLIFRRLAIRFHAEL